VSFQKPEPAIPIAAVLAALSSSEGRTVQELASGLACGHCTPTIIAHLLALHRAGKVKRDGQRWRLSE